MSETGVTNNNIADTQTSSRFNFDWKKSIKKKFPPIEWVPKYTLSWFLHDLLAGFTVGLTEIPQGIAYASVAGLPLEYGLYSGFMGCFMYFIFGSCKDINIGPTAIMALMIQPHVSALGADMAVLICFLSGCIIFVLGLLHLGFIVEFFSYPVIAGFTSAAAVNIASSQIKSLLGISGKSDTFLEAWTSVFKNIGQTRKWDLTLGLITIAFLVALKEIRVFGSLKHRDDWSKGRNILGKCIFMISLSRNALGVVIGTVIAYGLENGNNTQPFVITGPVKSGLPHFDLPPFSTQFNGTNYDFSDMVSQYGSVVIFCPLIAILEHIAIAKAFSKGRTLDATQEMLALGAANIMGSFVGSMPVTGSFTRTAVNNSSGVKTTISGVITGIIVLLALGFLTSAFYYIPKATLAAVVMVAMFYLFDFEAFVVLWRTKKLDLVIFLVTLLTCLLISLEYGILIGIATNLTFVLYNSARPKIEIEKEKLTEGDLYMVTPRTNLYFTSAEYLRERILKECTDCTVFVEGKYIRNIDATVAKSFMVIREELNLKKQQIVFWKFKDSIKEICKGISEELVKDFKDCDKQTILEELKQQATPTEVRTDP